MVWPDMSAYTPPTHKTEADRLASLQGPWGQSYLPPGVMAVLRMPPPWPRTFALENDLRKVWVKTATQKGFPYGPTVQRRLEGADTPGVLRCTYIFDRVAALAFEASRLRRLGAAGHPVPHVLAQSGTGMVLSDTGRSLWDMLRRKTPSWMLSEAAGIALAVLHEAGEYHGQPYPKNLTWDGQRIHFIDLEDDASAMGQTDRRLRDLWLCVHGHWPFAKAVPDLGARIANAYTVRASRAGVRDMLDRTDVMDTGRARLLHGLAGTNVNDNLRRYRWTLQSVRLGLRGRLSPL